MNMTTRLLTLALTAALATTTASAATAVTPRKPAPTVKTNLKPAPVRTPALTSTIPVCTTPAPVTVEGYQAMFAKIDPVVWGAADTSLSVPMPDGRSVWLYSDTAYSKPGYPYNELAGWSKMYHSSAIVQNRGCLTVAPTRWGGQVLPNDPIKRTYYWIDSATAYGAAQLRVVGYELDQDKDWTVGWTGKFRAAILDLRPDGRIDWNRWLGYVTVPQPLLTKDDGIMGNSVSVTRTGEVVIPAVFPAWTYQQSYSPFPHPQLKLADGQTLVTLASAWGGPDRHTWQEWRPMFFGIRAGAL